MSYLFSYLSFFKLALIWWNFSVLKDFSSELYVLIYMLLRDIYLICIMGCTPFNYSFCL